MPEKPGSLLETGSVNLASKTTTNRRKCQNPSGMTKSCTHRNACDTLTAVCRAIFHNKHSFSSFEKFEEDDVLILSPPLNGNIREFPLWWWRWRALSNREKQNKHYGIGDCGEFESSLPSYFPNVYSFYVSFVWVLSRSIHQHRPSSILRRKNSAWMDGKGKKWNKSIFF